MATTSTVLSAHPSYTQQAIRTAITTKDALISCDFAFRGFRVFGENKKYEEKKKIEKQRSTSNYMNR